MHGFGKIQLGNVLLLRPRARNFETIARWAKDMPPVRSKTSDEVVAAMLRWSEEFIEHAHWVVRDLPICPFANATRLLLKTASDSLLGPRYYDHFTPIMLRAVGMPRDELVQERRITWSGSR
jgi:hypothetical protein